MILAMPASAAPARRMGDKPHRYRFTVWALDVPTLPVNAEASGALVGYLLHSHALASAQLTATAGR